MENPTAGGASAQRLKQRMRHELRWLRARLAGYALLLWLGAAGMVTAVAVLTRHGWMGLGPLGAWIVLAVLALLTALVVFGEFLRPLRRVANLKGFSREVEAHGDFANLLEAATQFSSKRREDPLLRGASPELVEEILRRASAAAEASRLAPRVPLVGISSHVALAVVALLLWAWIGIGRPGAVIETWRGLSEPSLLAQGVPTTGLYSISGAQRVAVGGAVELAARDFTRGDDAVLLEINRTGDFWQQVPVAPRATGLYPSPWREVVAQVDRVEDPFRYRFRKGELLSSVFEVAVRERPVITDLSLDIVPPEYSGRAPRRLENPGGTVTVLEGTRIGLLGRASAALNAARRSVEDTTAFEMTVDGETFSDTFLVASDLEFRLELVDTEGLDSEAPTLYRIVAEPDDPPTVRITDPAEDRALGRDLLLEIRGIASDDVGLTHLDLVFRTELETEWTHRRLWTATTDEAVPVDVLDLLVDRGESDAAVDFTWDLGELSLLPGDAVVYALEAVDNNALEGGQVARSSSYRLRLPTIAEVFDIDREERAEDNSDLRDLLTEGKEIREDLERLERELKKDPDPDWTKQKEIEETLQRQQELRDKLEDTFEEMQQRLDEFERNNAGSLEMADKMETIQELLEELKDDQGLQAYLEAMREAMEQSQPQEMQRQMADALGDQEEFNRRLDRTIELLEQLERERAMSDLVEEINEYVQRQEQLAELTEPEESAPSDSSEQALEDPEAQSPDDSADESVDSGEESSDPQDPSGENSEGDLSDEELARMQQQLREETEALEERLRETLEELKAQQEEGKADNPSADEMRKALEEALEKMEEQAPTEPMESAEEELSDGDRESARQEQEEAIGRMLSLYEVMLEGQQAMGEAQGKFAGEQLQRLAFDLLHLSFREEEIVDVLREGVRGQQMRPITREQNRVTRATETQMEKLEELARQEFNISERLISSMHELVELSEDTVGELQLSRARRSRDAASTVMGKMNELVIGLLTAAKNAGGGGGSGQPMPSLSQQMEKMSEEQQRLNGMTQQMREQLQQGLGEEERRQLAELRARQEAIRQQLEEMRGNVDDERRILGDLEDLERSMEVVEDDLGGGRLDEDLERQQERILSRLLDAQRSVRERDFAKRRESRGGDELFGTQEGESSQLVEDAREEALRRWQAPDKAPDSYREDVRRYFRRVQEELDAKKEGGR